MDTKTDFCTLSNLTEFYCTGASGTEPQTRVLNTTINCIKQGPNYVCLNGLCQACTPLTDTQLCANNKIPCGTTTVTDNCGTRRTVTCGGPCRTTWAFQDFCVDEGTLNQTYCPDTHNWSNRLVPCPEGTSCINNKCCMPWTDAQFCANNQSNCGPITATDPCGVTKTVDCGTCTPPDTCVNHNCCSPPTDAEVCLAYNSSCGTMTVVDRCGTSRTVDCGVCAITAECLQSPPFQAGVCRPFVNCTDSDLGNIHDNGTTSVVGNVPPASIPPFLHLGSPESTPPPSWFFQDFCNDSVTLNQTYCPSPNNWSNRIVTCPNGEECADNKCVCIPWDNATFCLNYYEYCGNITAKDNCDFMRTVECRPCTTGQPQCLPDCSYTIDGLCHAACVGINGCVQVDPRCEGLPVGTILGSGANAIVCCAGGNLPALPDWLLRYNTDRDRIASARISKTKAGLPVTLSIINFR
jgi:hypothetical protein